MKTNKTVFLVAFMMIFATTGVVSAAGPNSNSGNPFDVLQSAINDLTEKVTQLFTKTEDLQNQVNDIDARNTTVNVQNNVPVPNVTVNNDIPQPNVTVINNVNAGNNASKILKYKLFLKIDDIKGESTDNAHKEWIDALAYHHDMKVTTTLGGSSGGLTVGKPVHSDFVITKQLDKASPTLALDLNKGTHIRDAELDIVSVQDGHTYMKYKLSNVMISSISISGDAFGDNARPLEDIGLKYEKIEWVYSTRSGDIHTGWDLAAGKSI